MSRPRLADRDRLTQAMSIHTGSMAADPLERLLAQLALTEPLGENDRERVIVAAIHDRILVEVLAELAARGHPVAEWRDACARLQAATAADEARLARLLDTVGIGSTIRPLDPADRLLRLVQVDVGDRRSATRAVETLEADGFRRWAPSTAGAWQAFLRHHPSVSLTRPDDDDAPRVEVRWPTARPGAGRGWRRVITPTTKDFELVALPAWGWPVYSVLRPVRLLAERLGLRRRSGPDLGPFLATPAAVTAALLQLADPSPEDVVVDIGCDDGRLVIAAATRFGCRARGLELDDGLAAVARAAARRAGCADLVSIEEGDALAADLADATVVLLFLPAGVVEQGIGALLDRLSPGCRVLAHEQHAIRATRPPVRVMPIITAGGVTVVTEWVAPTT